MGIFSINRFDEPGKGVDKDAPPKKRFFLFWEIFGRKFWKLIPLSLLFTLCCIPVVTIGPAIAGLTYVLRNFATEQPAFVASDFWDAFKKNWKYSVIVSLLDVAAIVILSIAIPFYYSGISSSRLCYIPLAVCVLAAVWVLFMNYYIFLMIVSLDLKLKPMLKNAALLASAGIKSNLITTLVVALFVLGVFLTFPYLTIFYFLFMACLGFAFLGLVICFNSYQHILKYIVEPYYAKQNRLKPLDENKEEEEPIFQDIGSKEERVVVEKKKRHGKTIR